VKVFIGADHRGYELKKKVVDFLKAQGQEPVDVGTHNGEVACDYPQFSYAVATSVVKTANSKGILICNTGIGHSIAANKVPGAYAALCYNKEAAALSRQHNNSNILVIGSKFVSEVELLEIIQVWLKTEFEGGRHQARIDRIKQIEQEFSK
jgi:RpiB/LacA/LacB family sugar-phosphate isomerase